MSDDVYDEGSRTEAAAAGVHHEVAEAEAGVVPPREHVTADARLHPHHHPDDPNVGVVRGRLGPHAALAGSLAAVATIAAVVLLALAMKGH